MPSTGDSTTQASTSTRRRRRSRCVPILVILGISLISFICITIPLRYFDPEPPSATTVLTDNTQQLYDQSAIEERRVVKSYDSFLNEAVNFSTTRPISTPLTHSQQLSKIVGKVVDTVGDLVLALFGFDEQDWFDFSHEGLTEDEEHQMRELGIEGIGGGAGGGGLRGNGLSSWGESSLYVERTQSLHPSRPSAFGPHLLEKPLRGFLYPISLYASSSYGCSLPTDIDSIPRQVTNDNGGKDGEEEWIALVQRGECPFSNKVRIAQELGASAVVFGDQDEEKGGIKGGKGLLTPWSPDDTKDIRIPSIFVSRASYLSLIKTWQDEQRIVLGGNHDQIDLEIKLEDRRDKYVGLEVVLSKDEMFAWPLLDLLFLLLFLPSLLTLLTVFTQRVRMARAQKAERAPKSAVAKLVVFKWGEPSPEKTGAAGTATGQATTSSSINDPAVGDEEREIGLTLQPQHESGEETVDESTSLLRGGPTTSTSTASNSLTPHSLVTRLRSFLPRRLLRRRSSSLVSSSSSSSLPLRGPNPRYPSLTDCSICLDSFIVNESIVIELPCSHLFHRDCAMSWLLTRKGVCPICRKSVMEDDSVAAPAPAREAVADEGVGRGD
ncbi:hypothetical protein JCM3765_007773 [Sporobolomyces pararoseus]